MRSLFIFLLMGMLFTGTAQFDAYFENKSLRIDYQHAGNSTEDFYFLDEVKIEPFWGGSRTNLIDPFGYGEYQIKVFDQSSGQLIFSRGYSTLFMEWQTTAEAKKLQKSFSETVCLPLPKKPARIEFYTPATVPVISKKNTNTHSIPPIISSIRSNG